MSLAALVFDFDGLILDTDAQAATRAPGLGPQGRQAQFYTEVQHNCVMLFQIADVETPLILVSQLAGSGNRVLFNAE